MSFRELSDGRVLVTDFNDQRIAVADFARNTSKNVGSRGDGPGEFSARKPDEFFRRLRAAVAPVWVKADVMFGVDNAIWIALPYAGGAFGEWLILDPKGEPVYACRAGRSRRVPRW